mgnify:CR=1 FL=1
MYPLCAIPAFPTDPYCNSWSGSVGYGVYSQSKNKQAAYDVVELIASKKSQLLIASTGFAIPFYDDEETLNEFYKLEQEGGKPANTAAFIEAAKHQRSNRLTYLPGSFRWKTQIDLQSSKIFEKNLNKRVEIESWLSDMQSEIGKILATDYPTMFGKK